MIYLLDVNMVIAAIWEDHTHHARADAWLQGKSVALCPLSELGFLRVSTHPKALKASMSDANSLLTDFWDRAKPDFVPCDLAAVGLKAQKTDQVTDTYLVLLAEHHGMKLATMDAGISGSAVELVG